MIVFTLVSIVTILLIIWGICLLCKDEEVGGFPLVIGILGLGINISVLCIGADRGIDGNRYKETMAFYQLVKDYETPLITEEIVYAYTKVLNWNEDLEFNQKRCDNPWVSIYYRKDCLDMKPFKLPNND